MFQFIFCLLFLIATCNCQSCPSDIQDYLNNYPYPLASSVACTDDGTITFQPNASLVFSIDGGVILSTSPIFTGLVSGSYFPYIVYLSNPSCFFSFPPLDIGSLPQLSGTFESTELQCFTDWTFTINLDPFVYGVYYSIDNGVTLSDNNVFHGNYGINFTIFAEYQGYPLCNVTLGSGSISALVGCPSPNNCTSNGIFYRDNSLSLQYGYYCVCKPISYYDEIDFCEPNCYMDTTNGQYVTIEGYQQCDKRYTKLYDGPCCYDCQDCRPSPI